MSRPTQADARTGRRLSWPAASALGILIFVTTSSSLAAWTGVASDTDYLLPATRMRQALLKSYLAERSSIMWSASRGKVDPAAAFPNPENAMLEVTPDNLTAAVGDDFTIYISAHAAGDTIAWGMATVDFGDGTTRLRIPVVGVEAIQHTYSAPGSFALTVNLSAPGGYRLESQRTVSIAR